MKYPFFLGVLCAAAAFVAISTTAFAGPSDARAGSSRNGVEIAALAPPAADAATAPEPMVMALIDKSRQRMVVYVDGVEAHSWKVSTARRGYRTPVGQWNAIRTHKMWYSRKYDNSPMPYSVFFYGGYAIHGTNAVKRLGRPASHGCIRLTRQNARTFYQLVRARGMQNTMIMITK